MFVVVLEPVTATDGDVGSNKDDVGGDGELRWYQSVVYSDGVDVAIMYQWW